MPAFTQKITLAVEKLIQDQYGVVGRPVAYSIYLAKALNCDKGNETVRVLSAGLSAQAIAIAPLGVSAPPMLLVLSTDQPVDVRVSATDATVLSAVRLWAMAGFLSSLYITTGSNDTTLWLTVAGGSAAALEASFPLP